VLDDGDEAGQEKDFEAAVELSCPGFPGTDMRYGNANKSTATTPSTNVPVLCEEDGYTEAGKQYWRNNVAAHYATAHPNLTVTAELTRGVKHILAVSKAKTADEQASAATAAEASLANITDAHKAARVVPSHHQGADPGAERFQQEDEEDWFSPPPPRSSSLERRRCWRRKCRRPRCRPRRPRPHLRREPRPKTSPGPFASASAAPTLDSKHDLLPSPSSLGDYAPPHHLRRDETRARELFS